MKTITDRIGNRVFSSRLNMGRYLNRIFLSTAITLSYPNSIDSYYKGIDNPASSVELDILESVPISPEELLLEEPLEEPKRQYMGRKSDALSIEDITDESLRKDVRRKFNRIDVNEFNRINRRIERFSTLIESSSNAYNLDDELVASVIYQESSGNPRARSPKGALGLMQVSHSAVKEVTGNGYRREEIMNPKNNIPFGTDYLSRLIDMYGGNIALGLAAYNFGPTRLNRQLNRRGIRLEDAVWDNVRYFLPRETREYVPGVLSKVLMMEKSKAADGYLAFEEKKEYAN